MHKFTGPVMYIPLSQCCTLKQEIISNVFLIQLTDKSFCSITDKISYINLNIYYRKIMYIKQLKLSPSLAPHLNKHKYVFL